MSPLLYVLRKTYKNAILQVFKNPISLIGYLIFIGFMVLNSLTLIFDSSPIEIKQQSYDFYMILVTGFVILSVFPTLYKSIGNVNLPLRAADTHFLFTAPIKPSYILIYAQIIQSLMSILVALLMIIQGPLLIHYLDVSLVGVIIFVFTWAFLLISISPISMFVFTLQVRYTKLKRVFKIAFFISLFALIIVFLYGALNADSLISGVMAIINHPVYDYLPFIGWYKVMFEAAVYGITLHTLIIFGIALVTAISATILMIKLIDTSFYESAIQNAQKVERVKSALNKGENMFEAMYQHKNRRAKNMTFQFHGSGAAVIRQKYYLELRKSSIFLLDISSLIGLVLSIVVAYLLSQNEGIGNDLILSGVLFVNLAMLFFNSMTSNNNELSNPYIYMIPESPFKKLFAIIYWRGAKILIDTFIPLVVVSIFIRSIQLELLLIPIITVAFGLQVYFTDIILSTFIGNIGTLVLRIYIKMFVSMISLMPTIIMIVVMLGLGKPLTFALFFTGLMLIGLSSGFFVLATRMFNKPEVYI